MLLFKRSRYDITDFILNLKKDNRGLGMRNLSVVSRIILKDNAICPYKDICPFNKDIERCYGALERENDFVCNLDELRLMFLSQDE